MCRARLGASRAGAGGKHFLLGNLLRDQQKLKVAETMKVNVYLCRLISALPLLPSSIQAGGGPVDSLGPFERYSSKIHWGVCKSGPVTGVVWGGREIWWASFSHPIPGSKLC